MVAARSGLVALAIVVAAGCAAPGPSPSTGPGATDLSAPSMAASPSLTQGASPGPTSTPSPSPTPTPTASPTAAPTRTPAPQGLWFPPAGTTWQWQLSGQLDLSTGAAVFDLDAQETSAATVARLQAAGRHVICYVDVGTWESYRPDAGAYPEDLLGNPVDGWPDERWLDIRAISRLAPILEARLDVCAAKGFDAVEPDWLNHHEEETGFPITRGDAIRFARWVAGAAHARGLAVAQKNAPDLVPALVDEFDFAITEDCARWDECEAYLPYVDRGAAVLDAEYELAPAAFCPVADRLGISMIAKRLELDAWRRTCP